MLLTSKLLKPDRDTCPQDVNENNILHFTQIPLILYSPYSYVEDFTNRNSVGCVTALSCEEL
jgi:hypothetical protein